MTADEFEWVPIEDTPTAHPGSAWWDVKGREQAATR